MPKKTETAPPLARDAAPKCDLLAGEIERKKNKTSHPITQARHLAEQAFARICRPIEVVVFRKRRRLP